MEDMQVAMVKKCRMSTSFCIAIVALMISLLAFISCQKSPQSANTAIDKQLESAFSLLDSAMAVSLGYKVEEEDSNVNWRKIYIKLEAFYISSGLLKSKSKAHYTTFLRKVLIGETNVDSSELSFAAKPFEYYGLYSPGYIWASIGHFQSVAKEYDSSLPVRYQFKSLSEALREFYITYNDIDLSDLELAEEMDELLLNYDDRAFEQQMALRVFFINFTYATLFMSRQK